MMNAVHPVGSFGLKALLCLLGWWGGGGGVLVPSKSGWEAQEIQMEKTCAEHRC